MRWHRLAGPILCGLLLTGLLAPGPLPAPPPAPVYGGAAPGGIDRRAIPMLVTRGGDLVRYGTGVVVGPSTILTAKHAVGAAPEIVLPTGMRVKGRTVCRARVEDLAVVRARLPTGTPSYALSSRPPAVGESVRVAGYPGRRWTTAGGRVTYIISSAVLGGRRIHSPMIVFRPALSQGASGAPVFNRRNQVVGIFVASNRSENYSIAFPAATALRVCRSHLK
ncbi:MAG: serine protease [Armatimonadota bacterium]|nr:serine protease [Armatimonadota bacterium]MDR7466271.1 serine protease [Armatimonadota bacterium]MDR7492992.1 serine protease [Armatimonadota bacterium]MDR7498251.1 serine protease [Armatimonadota bacterium]MDR7503716.1 serine protease [Armatimonadota bacterium]